MISRVEISKEKSYKSHLQLLYHPTDQPLVKLRFQWICMLFLTLKVIIGISVPTEWLVELLISVYCYRLVIPFRCIRNKLSLLNDDRMGNAWVLYIIYRNRYFSGSRWLLATILEGLSVNKMRYYFSSLKKNWKCTISVLIFNRSSSNSPRIEVEWIYRRTNKTCCTCLVHIRNACTYLWSEVLHT